jgi:PKD repeat protein
MALSVVLALAFTGAGQDKDKDKEKAAKPKLTVKVSPPMGGTAPARIVASADLIGGAPDGEELYCPAVEWDFGDDTKSTASADCDPYEAGKTEIRRRFTAQHTYSNGGNYRVQLRLKKKNKVIVSGSTSVQIRPGIHERDGLQRY